MILIIIIIIIIVVVATGRGSRAGGSPRPRSRRAASGGGGRGRCLRAKDCTREINTSEIIVDFQLHLPMDLHLCDYFWCVIFCPECRTGRWPRRT